VFNDIRLGKPQDTQLMMERPPARSIGEQRR
jgi:hypothetical protein